MASPNEAMRHSSRKWSAQPESGEQRSSFSFDRLLQKALLHLLGGQACLLVQVEACRRARVVHDVREDRKHQRHAHATYAESGLREEVRDSKGIGPGF